MRMDTLSTSVSDNAEGTMLKVDGRITIDSSPALRDRLLAILRQESRPVLTIDLTAVPYIDCSGLATLLEGLKIARAHRTALRLQLHDRPRYLLEVTGLLPFFDAENER
jgi:anti-sigma B factor antagonist